MNSIIKSTSKRIKEAVKKAGGNKVVSKKENIPISTLDYYIAGKSDFKLTKLNDIAIACDVDLNWLIGGKPVAESQYMNIEAIAETMSIIENYTEETGKELAPEIRSELILTIYDIFKEDVVVKNTPYITKLLKLVS